MKNYFLRIIVLSFFLAFESYSQVNSNDALRNVQSLMIDGKYREAISKLNSIIEIDSSNTDALYYLGSNYEAISDYNKAATALKAAVKYKPDNTKLLLSLGNNYFSSGLISQADTVLLKAFLLDSTNSQIQILSGKVYMSLKKWDKAASMYSRLIGADSANSYFYEQAAKCQSQLGNIEKAISFYNTANLLNPKNINTTLELSYLLYIQKQYGAAIKVVDAGLKFYRFSPNLYERKADIYMQLQDYKNALSNYYSALAYGDSSADNLKNIGISLYWKGQNETTANDSKSAVNFLEHSTEKNSEDAVTYFYLGALYKSFKEYNKSLDNFILASKLLKNAFLENTYVQIGAVYQLEGKYKDALDYYQDALRENPADKSALFYIGNSYDKLKNKKMASYYFKKFIKESPNGDKKLLSFARERIESLK